MVYEEWKLIYEWTKTLQESFKEINDFIKNGIKRLVINTDYMNYNDVLETVKAYQRIMNGENSEKVEEEYRETINSGLLNDGYYDEKSIK